MEKLAAELAKLLAQCVAAMTASPLGMNGNGKLGDDGAPRRH